MFFLDILSHTFQIWCSQNFRKGCMARHKVTPRSHLWEHGGAEVRGEATSTGMTFRRNNAPLLPFSPSPAHRHVSTVNSLLVRSTRAYHGVDHAYSPMHIHTHIHTSHISHSRTCRRAWFAVLRCERSSTRLQKRSKNYSV